MSGDVQPRKRKEKRRRRVSEEEEEGSPARLVRSGSSEHGAAENLQIHVHKEVGTGGHWCARIVFFALLAALLGVVGLIILEHRGTTDVDTPVTASKFAVIFEGWVDDSPAAHEEEEAAAADNEDNSKDEELKEHEEHEEHDEHDEHEEEEEEEEEPVTEEAEDEGGQQQPQGSHEDEEEEEEDRRGQEDDDDEDDRNEARDNEDEDADEQQVSIAGIDEDDGTEECSQADEEAYDAEERRLADRTVSEEDEGIAGTDEDNEEDNEEDQSKSNDDDDDEQQQQQEKEQFNHAPDDKDVDADKRDDEGYSEESFIIDDFDGDLGALEEIEDDNEDDDIEGEITESFNPDLDFSIEGIKNVDENEFDNYNEDAAEEFVVIPGVNDIDDDSAEPLEEVDGEEPEEIVEEMIDEEEKIQEELKEESTNVAMKFGVGVALIVAAHFVLIRRWNNGDAENEEIFTGSDEVPDLSRRNTLVSPIYVKEVVAKNEIEQPLNKEQEQAYEELRSTYKTAGSEKKRTGIQEIFAKKTADLEMMLRGEKDLKSKNTPQYEDEDENLGDEQDYENEEEYEDEDEEDEEEEYDEGEEEDEDVDDTDLVEKLDKKYGKLPTSPRSEEDDGNEEEEEEEEEEDDEEEYEEEEEEEEEEEGEEEDYEEKDYYSSETKPQTQSQGQMPTKSRTGGQQTYEYFSDLINGL